MPTPAEISALITATAALAQTDTAGKAYDDIRGAIKQLASIPEALATVVAAPFKIGALHANRWVRISEAALAQVPAERCAEPPPSIAGQIFENVKYIEEGSPLLRLYEQLLASACDREKINLAHPAFGELIKQLSADEAILLYRFSKGPIVESFTEHNFQDGRVAFAGHMDLPEQLIFPNNARMYLDHLGVLNLVGHGISLIGRPGVNEAGLAYTSSTGQRGYVLTDFGRFFASACIPEAWPIADPLSRVATSAPERAEGL